MIENFNYDIRLRPDVFPFPWECKELSSDDVYWICDGINPSSKRCTKSRLNSEIWNKELLCDLIKSFGESWKFDGGLIICVWDVNQEEIEPPIGIIAFEIAWLETKAKRINLMHLNINLIWVRPDKRGLGGSAARHVVSHLMYFLDQFKLIHPYVSLNGADVLCYAEFYSTGGEKLFDIIKNYLDVMKDMKVWKIREINEDAGY